MRYLNLTTLLLFFLPLGGDTTLNHTTMMDDDEQQPENDPNIILISDYLQEPDNDSNIISFPNDLKKLDNDSNSISIPNDTKKLDNDSDIFSLLKSLQNLDKSSNIISTSNNLKSPYDLPKIISPLVVEDVDLKDVFFFEGTHPIKYQYNISELLSANKHFIFQLLPSNETCQQSQMVNEFCEKLSESVTQLDKELHANVRKLSKLRTKSKASAVRMAQLKNLPNEKIGNGTSDFVETLVEKEKSLVEELNATIANSIATIGKAGNHPTNNSVISYLTMAQVLGKQRARANFIKNILTNCQKQYVPQQVINPEAFQNDVDKLSEEIQERGFTLVVPEEGKNEILELAMADCSVENEQLHITVNLPVRQLGNWTFKTGAPIPFKSDYEKCKVLPEYVDSALFAGVDNEYSEVNTTDYSIIPRGVHLIRRNDPENQEKYSCWFPLLKNISVTEPQDHCQFHCKTDNTISMVGLGGNKYIVTGAHRVDVRCNLTEKSFPFPEYGSLEIDLEVCKCEMKIHLGRDVRQMESPFAYCSRPSKGFPLPVHVIPTHLQRAPTVAPQKVSTQPRSRFNIRYGTKAPNQIGNISVNSTTTQQQPKFNSSVTPAIVHPTNQNGSTSVNSTSIQQQPEYNGSLTRAIAIPANQNGFTSINSTSTQQQLKLNGSLTPAIVTPKNSNQEGPTSVNTTPIQQQPKFNSSLTPIFVIPTKGTSETGQEKIKTLPTKIADTEIPKSEGVPLRTWVVTLAVVLSPIAAALFLLFMMRTIDAAICKKRPVVSVKPRLIKVVKKDMEGEGL